jgi:cell division transport system permease protein
MMRKEFTAMSLNSLRYVLKETLISLRRNAWMSLASVATVAISLVILGFALTLVYNTTKMAANIESDIEISTFMRTDQTAEQVSQAKAEIEKLPEVRSVDLVTKEKALEQFRTTVSSELIDNLGGSNPLPDKLTVKTFKPDQVKLLADKVAQVPGVDKVQYGQGVVDKIIEFTHWVRWIGISLIGLLGLASIVLISITIKFTVFARRREVQIMKFVGATDWFIRWPFLMEGMFLGLIGSIISTGIVVYGYTSLISYLHNHLAFIPVSNDSIFVRNLVLLLLGSGALIGSLGSMASLRKFLRA